jgi:hypothetical protein
VHYGIRSLSLGTVAPGYLPPDRNLRFVLHAWIGASRNQLHPGMGCDLPPDEAHVLQPDLYCRPFHDPGFSDKTRIHLFGLVTGTSVGHCLGAAQAWFPLGQELLDAVLTAHVRADSSSTLVAKAECWRPNLEELHREIFTTAAGGTYGYATVTDDYYVVPDPSHLTAQAS